MSEPLGYHKLVTIMADAATRDLVPLIEFVDKEDRAAVNRSIISLGGEEKFKARAMELAERAIDCVLRHARKEA